MKAEIKKAVGITAAGLMVVAIICGCYKKEDSDEPTLEDYKSLAIQNQTLADELTEENTQLKVALSAYGESIDTNDDEMFNLYELAPDGSRDSFLSINNKIAVDKSIDYEYEYAAAIEPEIKMTDSISVTPSSNWVARMDGKSIELSHELGIACRIDVFENIMSDYDPLNIKDDALVKYFDGIGCKKVKYSNLYLDSMDAGYEGVSTINIKRKDENGEKQKVETRLISGVIMNSEYIIKYRITFDREKEDTLLELARTLIKSIKVDGISIAY